MDRRGVQTSSLEEMCGHVSNLQKLQILRKSSIGRLGKVLIGFYYVLNLTSNIMWGGVRGDTPNIIKILKRFQNQVANNEFIYPHRQLYKASSTIYHDPEVGDDLTERLKSSEFDLSVPSRKRKTDRPRERNEPARGMPRVRELGRHKTGDFSFRKM